jgi:2-oxoacid dehydrogenases acyltransferase (catalytic domain)
LTYRIEPLPPARLKVLALLQDATRFAGRFTVHGLTEADVTEARRRLEALPDGNHPSRPTWWPAWRGRSYAHPDVNARRVGRRLLPTMRIPRLIRRPTVQALARVPSAAARFGPAIGISSLGMFGRGWGIPLSPMTLMVTVGGITRRPAMERGSLVEREFLPLTLSFDHSVVDGAPAAHCASTFGATLEACAVLDGDEQSRKSRSPSRAERRAGAVPQM